MVSDAGSRKSLRPAMPGLETTGLWAAGIYLIALPISHTAALRSVSLAVAFAVAVALWWRRRGPVPSPQWPRAPRLPLLPVFGIWLTAALVSLATTVDLTRSLEAISADIGRSFIVFFVFHTLTRDLDGLSAWRNATALGALALAALAVGSIIRTGQWTPDHLPALGDFATTGITVIPLLVSGLVATTGRGGNRLLIAAAIGGLFVGGYLTHSRGFWLTLLCAFLAAMAAYSLNRRRLSRKLLLGTLFASIVALGLATKVANERGLNVSRFDERSVIYLPVVEKILKNPLTGTGYGHETDARWYQANGMDAGVFHAHNIILSYLDQMGPLGLVVVLAIFGMPAVALLRQVARREAAPMVLAGLALLCAVFVKNNLDFFFCRSNLALFFAHLGIYLGYLDRRSEDQS